MSLDAPSKNNPFYPTFRKASELIQRNNYNLAISTIQKADPQKKDHHLQTLLQHCYQKQARKFWRQGNANEFKNLIPFLNENQDIAVTHAYLAGKQSLMELAKGKGVAAVLANCRLQSDLKPALLMMRQEHSLKVAAEGWLYLLKGDVSRAKDLLSNSNNRHSGRARLLFLHFLMNNSEKLPKMQLKWQAWKLYACSKSGGATFRAYNGRCNTS